MDGGVEKGRKGGGGGGMNDCTDHGCGVSVGACGSTILCLQRCHIRPLVTMLRRAAYLPSGTAALVGRRFFAAGRKVIDGPRIIAPPMVYIAGEEMTRYTMELILDKWITPNIDTGAWQYFDLSCRARDATNDQVLHDAVAAGKEHCSIFKEPTITPTAIQREEMGLKTALGSPNGAMRRGWNGITISRDTIHIANMELGFKRPVLFERHAVGGEYSAGWKEVGAGNLKTVFTPKDGSEPIVIDDRDMADDCNSVVAYHNPYDNITDLAHHFFSRCLDAQVTPYVVTKKTVFKWQEPFWKIMKDVFDEHYYEQYLASGLLESCGGQLQHLISDAATMQIIRWTGGGFGMAAHNYDGDMLTDEIAQVHRSPGFITSNLIGKREDGVMIKEFEASHGTVADMWEAHKRGEETSMNPLGMVEALIGAMNHSADLSGNREEAVRIMEFTQTLRATIHTCMVNDEGTRDLCGPTGLTTEAFIDTVSKRMSGIPAQLTRQDSFAPRKMAGWNDLDETAVKKLFHEFDIDGSGSVNFEEFCIALSRLGIQPKDVDFNKMEADEVGRVNRSL